MPFLARGHLAVVCAVSTAVHLGIRPSPVHAQEGVAPDESDACFTAAERAQPLMRQKRLREARVELEMCARDACPRVARSDCRSWLANVINEQPTIVVAGHEVRGTEVHDVHGIRATIDGAIIVENADLTPVAIDPGPHRLHLEREGGDALEMDVDIREGEKGRAIHAYWRGTARRDEPIPASLPPPTPSGVYVLGGLGVLAAAVGATFEIVGLSAKADLDNSGCVHNPKMGCSQAAVDDARNTVRVGDIALGGAVVLLAAAGYLYFTRPAVNTSPRGGSVTWAVEGTSRAFSAGLKGTW
jgi:hypothetical protein